MHVEEGQAQRKGTFGQRLGVLAVLFAIIFALEFIGVFTFKFVERFVLPDRAPVPAVEP